MVVRWVLNMAKTSQGRVCSSLLYSFRLSFVLLLSSIGLTSYLIFGFCPFYAIPVFGLLALFLFTFLKGKRISHGDIVQTEDLINSHENLLERVCESRPNQENETLSQRKIAQQTFPLDGGQSEDDSKSEDFELKWTSSKDCEGETLISSDESISSDDEYDDDNLIEIALPRQSIIGLKEERLWLESNFQDENLMELLEEISVMNGEENLIEIDISRGPMELEKLEI